ncbi:hypothetical protein AUJ15_00040 [Candidatus Micrarchaeota archaeon CG1_02_55_41]|nr:MAG: hypothetical protein AUJ15_00040 [Candidatus Micrarchaeota archaeon CG1_02_55_41]
MEPIDYLDVGNADSEATHAIAGWSAANNSGSYGGCNGGIDCSYRQVIEQVNCNDDGRNATFTLNVSEGRYADKLRLRSLDGLSDFDSFDVYVDGEFLANYTDVQDGIELWNTLEYALANKTGVITILLSATDAIWPSCGTYGQVAVDWADIGGFTCEANQEPTPTPTATPTPTPTPTPEPSDCNSTAGALAEYYSWTGHGGVFADGIGLRPDPASKTITVTLPENSTVVKAFMYWSAINLNPTKTDFSAMTLNGLPVNGSEIGSFVNQGPDYCVLPVSYRADVTEIVNASGSYVVGGDGSSLFNVEGAGLVVVYSDEASPNVRVMVNDGAGNDRFNVTTVFNGFASAEQAGVTFMGGGGGAANSSTNDAVASLFNGNLLSNSMWDDSDGTEWDTDAFNVTQYVSTADSSATAQVDGQGLLNMNWVAAVLAVEQPEATPTPTPSPEPTVTPTPTPTTQGGGGDTSHDITLPYTEIVRSGGSVATPVPTESAPGQPSPTPQVVTQAAVTPSPTPTIAALAVTVTPSIAPATALATGFSSPCIGGLFILALIAGALAWLNKPGKLLGTIADKDARYKFALIALAAFVLPLVAVLFVDACSLQPWVVLEDAVIAALLAYQKYFKKR